MAPLSHDPPPTISDPHSLPLDPHLIRADFPILNRPLASGKRLVYLDNGATTQKPQSVIDRTREVDETFYANAYRGVYSLGAKVDEELEASREAIRQFLGAERTEEIIFTSGTTAGVNIVAQGWGRRNLKPGDEIVLTILEHHANSVPWQQIAKETGAVLKWVPITERFDLDMEAFHTAITDRTRLVTVTGMSNVTGSLPDLSAITAAAHAVNARVFVDGAQLVSQRAVDVTDPQVDWFAFSGHKLHGPSGVGVLYGRREALEETDPLLFGGHMISEVTPEGSTWAELPARFEAGTLPITQAIALKAAVDYVTDHGIDAIGATKHALAVEADRRLREIPGLTIYGPPIEDRGSIISFTIEGLHPQDLAIWLDRFGVCVRTGHHCTMPLHRELGLSTTTRVTPAAYNTPEDIDTLIEGIEDARKKLIR